MKTKNIEGVVFNHQYADVNGVKIHYLIAGDGKKPVLLIHGFPGSWRSWKNLMGQLVNAGYTAIVPDFRGAGESSAPASGYDKKTMSQDLHALVRSLKFNKVAVIGHDMGLPIGYAYAAQFPDEVSKLVLMDAFLPGVAGWEQSYDGRPGKWHFRFFGDTAMQLLQGRERIYLDMFWNDFIVPGNAGGPMEERDAITADYVRPGRMAAAFSLYSTWVSHDSADNLGFLKQKLNIPVLSIGGDHSRGKTLVEQIKLITTDPHSIVMPNSAHWLLEEKPQETRKAIFDFLNGQAQ